MNNRTSRSFLLSAVAALILSAGLWLSVPSAHGFVDITEGWPAGSTIKMQLELGPTDIPLDDNTGTWNGSAANALSLWNPNLDSAVFAWVMNSTVPQATGDGYNTVFFSDSVFGDDFGADTLAVTVYFTDKDDHDTEADVVVNKAFQFNSYRGVLRDATPETAVYDIHRVLLHEFGHVLGLGHPDQQGDPEVALMNSEIGDLDHLTPDDQEGAKGLYGIRPTSPYLFGVSVGQPISFQLETNAPAVSYEVADLPPWLKLNTTTGLLTGTSTRSGVSAFMTITYHGVHTSSIASLQVDVSSDTPPKELRGNFYFAANRLLVDKVHQWVYATISNPPAVAVLDAATLKVDKTIPVEGEPFGMALSADAKKLYVAEAGEDVPVIGVISTTTLASLVSVPAPAPSKDVAVGLSNRLFVSALEGGSIYQIDATTGGSVAPFPITVENARLASSPDSKILYAGTTGLTASTVFAFDVSGATPILLKQTDTGQFPGNVGDFKVSHDGTFLCVPGDAKAGVSQLEAGDLTTTVHEFLIPGPKSFFDPFAGDAITLSPDDASLFVTALTASPTDSGSYTATLDLFSVLDGKYVRAISAGGFVPSTLVADGSGKYLFAASQTHNLVSQVRVYSTGDLTPPEHPSKPKSLLNVSTRLATKPGEDALIGGFIIAGTEAKKVAIRGLGSSLPVKGALADPVIELFDKTGQEIGSNDDWNQNRAAVVFAGLAPDEEPESSLVVTLPPGSYTVVVRDAAGGSGVALVEVYDLTPDTNSTLANISTRGRVETGDDVMIGGFIISAEEATKVLLRAIGPSLAQSGVTDVLEDPVLELHDATGNLISSNDNWQTTQKAAIQATTIPPSDLHESAIVATLSPGNYTAIVRGQNGGTGVALVEVYNLDYESSSTP